MMSSVGSGSTSVVFVMTVSVQTSATRTGSGIFLRAL